MKRKSIVSMATIRTGELLNPILEAVINNVNPREFGKNIAIKVNLSDFLGPELGVTTDPKFIESLIQIITENQPKAQINIVETNHWMATADTEFRRMGYSYLEDKFDNVSLVNLSREKRYRLFVNGLHLKYLNVPETLLKTDYLISVAMLKTHVFQRISCILKNQFGLIPERYKSKYHPFLTEVLVDLATIYRPDLCLIDGRIGLEGSGPTYGIPKKMDLIIAGNDPVAVDATAAQVMKIKPKKVPHLELAAKRDIGEICDYTIIGSQIEEVASKFQFIRSLQYWLIHQGFRLQRIGHRMSQFGNRVQQIANSLEQFKPSMLLRPRKYYRRLAYGPVDE